jgi:hypothetical protein
MKGVPQEELHREAIDRLDRAVAAADEGLRLTDEQLAWKPGPEVWGVAECLDHLVTTHDAYWPGVVKATGSTAPQAPPGNRVRSTLAGRLLRKGVDPDFTARQRSPSVFRPGRSEVPGNPVEAFRRAFEELRTRIEGTASMDWHRIRVASPAAGLIKLRLGDVYWVLVAHGQRHVNQAIRVTRAEGFPPP